MEYEHPLYTPASVAAQRAAARDRHRPDRLRRRLPRLGLPRGRCPLRPRRRRRRLGLPTWGRAARRGTAREAGPVYATTIRHTRRTPFRRTFTHRSHTWLVDLDDLPDHGARSAGSRRATTSATRTRRSATTSTRFLADHGVDPRRRAGSPDGGQRPRVRLLLQPDQRLLVLSTATARWPASWSRCTTPTATGTPTSSTPTSRAARAPTRQMYVSPVPRHRRPLRARRARARRPAATSPSPCTPTTGAPSAPRSRRRRHRA